MRVSNSRCTQKCIRSGAAVVECAGDSEAVEPPRSKRVQQEWLHSEAIKLADVVGLHHPVQRRLLPDVAVAAHKGGGGSRGRKVRWRQRFALERSKCGRRLWRSGAPSARCCSSCVQEGVVQQWAGAYQVCSTHRLRVSMQPLGQAASVPHSCTGSGHARGRVCPLKIPPCRSSLTGCARGSGPRRGTPQSCR